MKIYVGRQTPEHKGDTSRELINIWKELELCEVIEGEVEDHFLWANAPGDALLYEYDRWDVFPWLPSSWRSGLFGGMQHPNGLPWIYWGRRPKMLHEKIISGIKSFEERQIESIFLGKVENGVQHSNRTTEDWSKVIEFFSMPIRLGDSFTWPFTQQQYLEHVSNARFGLCLPGYGPKCNREIEYFGLGVVPLMVDGVDTKYHTPLLEGMHYFKIKNTNDIQKIIKECSRDRWEYMSYNCRKWYDQNCSPIGSFKITQRILEIL
jgi:hypothetical protein